MLRAYFSSSDVCYSNVVKTPFELLCIDLIPSIFSNYVSLPFKTDGPIVLETGDVLDREDFPPSQSPLAGGTY